MQPFIPHFIQEQYVANRFNGNIEGCVLFVDISGFTQMTQQLMDKGQKEGAEVLSNILNSIFEVMVKEVYHAQGFITHYAGDAFTSIFPLSDSPKNTALAALQCAQTIQDFFRKSGTQHSKFGDFDLQVKIGLSYGETNWGIVGDENIMGVHACKFYFRGQAIYEAAMVEQKAQKGQTMLSQSFKNTLKGTALKGSYVSPIVFCYEGIEEPSKVIFPHPQKPHLPKIQAEILNRFIPSEVAAFREKGEFRNIVSVFISFKNIHSHSQINTFTSIVLKHIIRYKGDLKEIDFGDKGAMMVGFFGAPVTHEDDLARALYFVEEVANEVQESEALKGLQFRIGITSGKVYAGILGGKYRCEYTCLGSIVNMAARIMMQTDWQQIWVNETIAAHPHFNFQKRGIFSYKGFANAIPTYQYLGKAKNNAIYKNDTQLIGHEGTLAKLSFQIAPIFEGNPAGISYIFGEAGIGKTRLVYALKEQTETQVKWVHIAANQILQKSFQPFKNMLSDYFLSPQLEGKVEQQEHFEAVFEKLLQQLKEKIAHITQIKNSPSFQSKATKNLPPIALLKDAETELRRTKPILAAQVGLQYSDSILQRLDAKGRYENTILAIKNLLKAFSLVQPLIIHLEDTQWLDADSIILLQRLVSNLSHYPIAILSTARYKDDGSQAILPFKNLPSHTTELTYLKQAQVKTLAESLLNQHKNEAVPIGNPFLKILVERSKGNPFFVEQLLRFFEENQWLQSRSGNWQLTQEGDSIPDSIQALLMARIDRLSKQVKEVVKVAAVIGREFDIHLLSMLLQRNVLAETKVAETEQIWLLLQDLKGIFRHTLLRDIAYDMQLKERLRQLHQFTAAAMEKLFHSNIQEKYADIAFHYEQSETTIKTIEYLEKAGDYAQENFQNQQALTIFERLLKQLKKLKDRNLTWKTLLKKATILRTIGQWNPAYEVYEEAKKLAIALQNQAYQTEVQFNLARIFSLQGKYQMSLDYYQESLEAYQLTENKMQIAQTIGFMGVVYINLSRYGEAAKCFQQQIVLASELNDPKNHATALGNLGSLFNQSGNYQAALDCYQKSYDLFESTGWAQNAAMNLANMGTIATIQDNYDAAMDYYQQSLERFEKVGYQHGMAYTTVNIGYTLMQKGLYAETFPYYEKSLRLSLEMNDRRLQAFTEGNIGIVYYHQGKYKQALEYLEKAIEGHQKIGFKHSLVEWYLNKSMCLYELAFYTQALDWVEQAIEVSQAISRTEILFKAQLLKGQIQFKMGEQTTATTHLQSLLNTNEQVEEQAHTHFELWRL
ncbi:MAG: tetratricopeptide repeat protein, partial [Chitinophagales bacterium]